MTVFLDTSSLIKLYHYEDGSEQLDQFFVNHPITAILLSEITKVELESALWKKVRTGELDEEKSDQIIAYFRMDYPKFQFVQIDEELVLSSRTLISKYGKEGLRTLDALQLASIFHTEKLPEKVLTADQNLKYFSKKEGLSIL